MHVLRNSVVAMNKLSKLGLALIAFIGLLLSLVVGFLLWFFLFFDLGNYKDELIVYVENTTGRQLELEDIALEFYPWLGVEMTDISLSNTQLFGQTPFFHADKLALRIKTLPLLKQQYELGVMQLHGAEVNLLTNSKGLNNWEDMQTQTAAQQSTTPIYFATVLIGGVDIKGFNFQWTNQATDQILKISDLDAVIGELVFGEPIDIKLNSKVMSNDPEIMADIKMQGQALYDLDAQTYAFEPIEIVAKLDGQKISDDNADARLKVGLLFNVKDNNVSFTDFMLDVFGIAVRANIQAENVGSDQKKIAAQLAVSGKNLALFFEIMGNTELANQLHRFKNQTFSLHSSVKMDTEKKHIAIYDLSATLLDSIISGQLEIAHMMSNNMTLTGKLKSSGSELATSLQVLGQLPLDNFIKLRDYGEKLSMVADQTFDVDTKFDVDLKSGDMTISNLTLSALGLSIKGNLHANDINSRSKDSIDGQLSLHGKKLTSLLKALEQDYLASILDTASANIVISGNKNDLILNPLQAEATFVEEHDALNKLVLNANAKIDIANQTLSLNDVNVNGWGLNVKANLGIEAIEDNLKYSGELHVANFDLRQFMQQAKLKAPKTSDASVFKKVGLQTIFRGSTDSMELNSISATLDDTELTGNFSLKNFATPTVNSLMKINIINLDRYIPPPTEAEGKALTKDMVADDTSLPFDKLKQFKIKSELQIDDLTISKLHLNNIKLGIDINDGLVSLNPIKADLYSGQHQGNIQLDTRKRPPKLSADIQVKGIEIAQLLADQTQSEAIKLSGITNINANLSAEGIGLSKFKDSVSGQASVIVNQGMFDLFSVGKIMRKLKTIIKGTNNTQFSQLEANFDIHKGIIKNDDFLLSAPSFEITGGINGRTTLLDMHKQSINYDLAVSVDPNNNSNKFVIPIECRGLLQVAATVCQPDYGAVLKSTFLGEIGRQLNKLQDRERGSKSINQLETDQQQSEQEPLEELKDILKKGILDKLF